MASSIITGTLPTLYDILGVDRKARASEVKSAYRTLARAYHPDISPDPNAHERMAALNAAFEVLSDPDRRKEYDRTIGDSSHYEPYLGQTSAKKPEAIHVRLLRRNHSHKTPIYGVAFSRDNGKMVSSAFDNEVIWWQDDLHSVRERSKLEGGVVSYVSAVRDGYLVAAGCTEQALSCWRVRDGQARSWKATPKEWVCCLSISPDGDSLATGGVGSQLRLFRTSDGSPRFSSEGGASGHKDSVTSLAWSSDSRLLASGSADATVRIWCGSTGKELHRIDQVISTVTAVAFSLDGEWLAAAAVDLSVRVFNLKDNRLHKTFFGHERPVESLAFHPRNWLLGSASRDGTLGLWNIAQGLGHARIDASHQPISCIAFSPDGLAMAAGGLDKVLRVWRLSIPA